MLPNAHALIIGLHHYEQFPPLSPSIVADTKAIVAILTRQGGYLADNTQILQDGQATQGAIRQALARLTDRRYAEATLFLYITAYGFHTSEIDAESNYIVPVDAAPEKLEQTAVSGQEILQALQTSPARQAAIFLDCHHGRATPSILPSTQPEPGLSEYYYRSMCSEPGHIVFAQKPSNNVPVQVAALYQGDLRGKRFYASYLRQLLTDRFNEGELRTLCFDLGVDYDDLPSGGKVDKARELVAYLIRHNRVVELVELGIKQRLDIDWSGPQTTSPQTNPNVFAYHLLAGLQGGAAVQNGSIHCFDLYEYMQPRITVETPTYDLGLYLAPNAQDFTIALHPIPPEANTKFLYDAYISYSNQEPDNDWVWEFLVPQLESQGLLVAVSDEVAEPGVARVVNMERGIQQAKRTIVVLSRRYLKDNMAGFEAVMAQTLGIEEQRYRLLPLKIEPLVEQQLPLRLRALTILDLSQPHRIPREMARLVKALQGHIP